MNLLRHGHRLLAKQMLVDLDPKDAERHGAASGRASQATPPPNLPIFAKSRSLVYGITKVRIVAELRQGVSMQRSRLVLAALFIVTLTGCHKPPNLPAAAPKTRLTEEEAIRIATAPMADWDTKNSQALDTMYAPDAIGFEPNTAPLVANGAAWLKINKDLLAMKFDKVTVQMRKVQILSNDVFILTSYTDMTSTNGPMSSTTWRCTDVFQRLSDGKFRIVNEHCSYPPKP